MIQSNGGEKRSLKLENLNTDLVVVGGGVAGCCAAITAARQGLKVIIIQDRPVLGGNASSEVRLWMLGATSHMGNNNRWAREGGVVDEILVENTYRNPEGNAYIFDTVMLEKIMNERNITLLLNTAVFSMEKNGQDNIKSVQAFCSQNSTEYNIYAPLFCDASGDGILGFLAGAAFRMGAESKNEFGEKFAPTKEYGELLGHSLYFYSKDTGKPVKFVPPAYALQDITEIPRFKNFNTKEYGCKLWWLEYGGRLDTIHDTENIKWELWKVVYGVWNYIKNSGKFPEAENLTLEWVGTIPGKRESRRFEGDYMLTQQDIVEQRTHPDAVAFGGWSIDLHPADGVFSEKSGCNQWHSKGLYQIPYRCLYSRNINNLFLAGRIISASHVAFGSSRVMATVGHAAQAVGMAAAICKENQLIPSEVYKNEMATLQQRLLKTGHHIPDFVYSEKNDLTNEATITASSELVLTELSNEYDDIVLDTSMAQMLPLPKGKIGLFNFHIEAEKDTQLEVELRISSKQQNHTPDLSLIKKTITLTSGAQSVELDFGIDMPHTAYAFIIFHKNPAVKLQQTNQRLTGVLTVFNSVNKAVSNYGAQIPEGDIGVDSFEFWCPRRRPAGKNLAFTYQPGIAAFGAENVNNGIDRPVSSPNVWLADLTDHSPKLTLTWQNSKTVEEIHLFWDTDYDHPMESVLMGHYESVMPFCVRNYTIKDQNGNILYQGKDNYQTVNIIKLPTSIVTNQIVIEVEHPSDNVPAALFSVRCYGQQSL